MSGPTNSGSIFETNYLLIECRGQIFRCCLMSASVQLTRGSNSSALLFGSASVQVRHHKQDPTHGWLQQLFSEPNSFRSLPPSQSIGCNSRQSISGHVARQEADVPDALKTVFCCTTIRLLRSPRHPVCMACASRVSRFQPAGSQVVR